MPFVGQQIIDTFSIYNQSLNRVSGGTFSGISLWTNGVTSNQAVSILESPISSGYYKVSFTPSTTGQWYVNFIGSTGTFEGVYDVTDTVDSSIVGSIWSTPLTAYPVSGTFGGAINEIFKITRGKWEMVAPNSLILYDEDGTSIVRRFNLFDLAGNSSLTGVVKRVPI